MHTSDQLRHVLGVIDRVLDKFAVCSAKVDKRLALTQPLLPQPDQRDLDFSSGITRRVGDPVTDPARIADFSCRVAATRSYPIPWLHRDDYEEVLRGRRLRIRSRSSFCHFIAENHCDPNASLCVTLEPQISLDSGCSTGALGHMHWMPGAEETIGNLISMATEWLVERGISLVIAPVQSPLLVLGGGISRKPDPTVYPMLQPHLPSVGSDILRSLGFEADIALPHWRLDLSRAASTLQAHIPKGIAFRSVDKTQLRREIAAILPVINRSLASLPYCDPLMMEELYSAANEFRNLIIDGLWKIAEFGSRPVGFIGALPDIKEALVEAAGAAGPADIHNSRLVLAKTKRASVVWLAIDPEFRDLGIGFALLKALYSDL